MFESGAGACSGIKPGQFFGWNISRDMHCCREPYSRLVVYRSEKVEFLEWLIRQVTFGFVSGENRHSDIGQGLCSRYLSDPVEYGTQPIESGRVGHLLGEARLDFRNVLLPPFLV